MLVAVPEEEEVVMRGIYGLLSNSWPKLLNRFCSPALKKTPIAPIAAATQAIITAYSAILWAFLEKLFLFIIKKIYSPPLLVCRSAVLELTSEVSDSVDVELKLAPVAVPVIVSVVSEVLV